MASDRKSRIFARRNITKDTDMKKMKLIMATACCLILVQPKLFKRNFQFLCIFSDALDSCQLQKGYTPYYILI